MTPRAAFPPLLLTCLTLFACAHAPPKPSPYFQPTAAQLGPELNSYGEAVAPRDALIVVQGDDLAYGAGLRSDRNRINGADEGQVAMTISRSLRRVLGRGQVQVENRGFPGDTVARSAQRWADAPAPKLLVLALGYGDMKAHTQITPFAEALSSMIRRAHGQGAAVFLVSPPASSDVLFESNLAPYRGTAEAVARQEGAEVFSAAASMGSAKESPVKSVGQSPRTYELIAGSMVPYIKLVAPPP